MLSTLISICVMLLVIRLKYSPISSV